MTKGPEAGVARPKDGSRLASDRRSPRAGNPAEMVNALDVLRVASTFFVLLYHAALAYMATPLRLTTWAAYDASHHLAFDTFVYWVNGFVMPVFFLAAGVSAPAACEARGPRAFLDHRTRRLLRPLLFGCLTVLPCTYLIWGYGLMATGQCGLDDILRWDFGPRIRPNLYGLGHLWFLEYLFVVSVLWCGGWALGRALRRGASSSQAEDGWALRMLASPWRPLLCAIPTALIFALDSDTMLRVDNWIVPNPSRVLHYAWFFAVGGWLSKVRDPKQRLIPWSRTTAVLAMVTFALMSPLLLRHAATPLHGWPRLAYCLLAALFPWLFVFGSLGLLLRLVRERGAALRFLSEASFWVYLVHVPVVALVQILLLSAPWPAPVKFLAVSAVAVVVSLLSYEFIVRRSLVGEIVNGARKRSAKAGRLGRELGWIATLVAVALLAGWGAWSYRVFFWGNNLYAVVPGQLYRSARLPAEELDQLIRREGLRSVVTFTSGGDRNRWFTAQTRVCQSHRVEMHAFNLSADKLPSRKLLYYLVYLLDHCPRPVLVQESQGNDQCGLGAAVVQLLRGVPPEEALGQFDARYGQFGGPEHSPLGQPLLAYRDWLAAQRRPHTAERFRAWVVDEYLVSSFPSPPADVRAPEGLIARGAGEPDATR